MKYFPLRNKIKSNKLNPILTFSSKTLSSNHYYTTFIKNQDLVKKKLDKIIKEGPNNLQVIADFDRSNKTPQKKKKKKIIDKKKTNF